MGLGGGACSSDFRCGHSSTLSSPWQLCCRFLCSTNGRALSLNAIALGVVGLLLAADAARCALLLFRRGWWWWWWLKRRSQRCGRTARGVCNQGVLLGEAGGNAESVQHYWVQLSDVILKAPRTSPGIYNRRKSPPIVTAAAPRLASTASSSDGGGDDDDSDALPEAVRLLWEDRVRYVLDEREVFALLRRGAMTKVNEGGSAVPAAAIALLWRLQLVRSVSDVLVVTGDVSRCCNELENLQEYSRLFFHAFIQPLEKDQLAAFAECWISLSAEESQLRRRRRSLQMWNVWSLTKYVYAGGRGKLVSCALMGVLTAVAARSASAGLALRGRVERLLFAVSPPMLFQLPSDHDISSIHATASVIASLLAFEWARLVVTSAVMCVTQDYIRASASQHRDHVKQRLYDALAHTSLTFFDTHDLDSVEELLYYTNDLEGVDVHVHDFFTRMVRAATALAALVAVLDGRSTAVVCGSVMASSLLTGALSLLRKRCRTIGIASDMDGHANALDAEELENGSVATDGVMLRGMEIIEHVHELRPYAADTALMSWWLAHTACYRQRPVGIWHVLNLSFRLRFVWAIDALSSILRWMLPVAVAAHAAATCQTQGVLLEAMHTVQEMLDQVVDTRRVVETLLSNAYKANALERLLDVRNWEGNQKEEAEEEELHQAATVEVCAIRADRLQFQYPTAPTVDAFLAPATFCVHLQDDKTGAGRLVCVTGPSGCGKTTLLRLLLALYTAPTGSLMLQLLRRRRSSPTHIDPPQDGSEGSAQWVPLGFISRGRLRSTLFSYVPQTATLFPGATIAQNVSLQNHVSLANTSLLSRVHACTEAAGCGDFISRLPQGLLTPLSAATGWLTPGAVRLSCGQGQRLMLARALFHGGSVLLMDEPTAGLDSESKWAVVEQWRVLLRSGRLRGVLCVTHDADVLQSADQVVCL